jgi:hypothetical protein
MHDEDILNPGDFFWVYRYLFLHISHILEGGTLIISEALSFEPEGGTVGSWEMAIITLEEGVLVPSKDVTSGTYEMVDGVEEV